MIARLQSALDRLPADWRDTAFWFIALASLVPALRADLLYPHAWFVALDSSYSMPAIDNPFGPRGISAVLLGLAAAALAWVSRRNSRWLAVLPWVSVALADSRVGAMLEGLNSVYVGSAFVVFLYFALFGEAVSLAFLAFVGLLALWQLFDGLLAWPQILVFVTAALVLRFAVEAVRQNWPLAKELGRSNVLSLAGRTLSLWWPMLILIAIGLWASNRITGATEQFMYERGYVDRYCVPEGLGPDHAFACPEPRERLTAGELTRLPSPDLAPEMAKTYLPRCILNRVRYESATPEPPDPVFLCPPGEPENGWRLEPLGYFANLDKTVERRYDVAEWDMRRKLNTIDVAALRSADRADEEAKRLFSVVPDSTGMTTETCYFPDIGCAAANIVINGVNSAYGRGRARAEEEFVEQAKERAGTAAKAVTAATDDVRDALTGHLNSAETRTRRFIDRVHTAGNLIRQLLLLWLIVVAIKSVLYVFSRVIFDKSTDIDIDLLERDGVPAEGRVTHKQEINIPGDYPYDLYYKANYQPLGPAPRFSIPQWRASALSRLRFGAWNMSRVAMPLDDERGVTFNSIEAEYLVDWELAEGEEVVFNYGNFVAMNENIQLRTVISLRVATLLLGRIVFHTARCRGGPGRLVLRTRGKPATAEQVRQSIPAARLIAWNRYARFSVDSHLTRADIFLNGFNLRRGPAEAGEGPQGILIVEADARDGGLLFGTLRFARNFLMPV